MTHEEVAKALINSFSTGDTTVAQENLTENYIQHNSDFGTGRDNFIAAVTGLQSAPVATTVKTIRSFEDGEYVVLHSLFNFAGAGEQIGFDVFRFEGDKIAEHWDNLAPVTGVNPSGHTQYDGETHVSDLANTASNKELVSGFVRDVLRGENPAALSTYVDGNQYIQHNSNIADGLDGLSAAMKEMAAQGVKMIYDRTFRVLGQGNFVLAMSQGNFNGKVVAFYDLFRVSGNKIVEHWDIIQEIPAAAKWKNQNGKF
ncbi:nuclear transport factor 2 family protein [uncultured Secundilactobacillus sp.]|uniref:nuclear transport factor 2 family protein n=1 Tax=uncultured Secundilactobacillus sp. TaxID=2813935 RepID=UPI00258FBF43|nr:nuclear transport factor 2 family protein [uncultured Secundilactobacillus sp.]